jgi:hypothetical protein
MTDAAPVYNTRGMRRDVHAPSLVCLRERRAYFLVPGALPRLIRFAKS